MKARFFSVSKEAAIRIIQERRFQSVEYEDGFNLIQCLKDGVPIATAGVYSVVQGDGTLLLVNGQGVSDYIVIDNECFSAFKDLEYSGALTVFQKICRACIKYWFGTPLSATEKLVSEKGILVVFPWSFSNANGSRILIDTKPDSKRGMKRNWKHLLVFKYCIGEAAVEPSYTVFRKFLDVERASKPDAPADVANDKQIENFSVTAMEGGFNPIDSRQGFSRWVNLLTKSQREIVMRLGLGPERIEGPAGTGKTLSLVLRCIRMIEASNERSDKFKIAFITHSLSTKENIISIFESNQQIIDLGGISAIPDVSVTTLQEWCVRELGNKIEESEIIDKDAAAAKEYQRLIIEDVLKEILKVSESLRGLVSDVLLNYLTENSLEYVVHTVHHEVSEVIKGRSSQDIEKYRKIPLDQHAVKMSDPGDFDFMFGIYSKYQQHIDSSGQFDSDDVVISALGQLSSPIWRRRRLTEGFDVCFVDETHLFNLNELSIIHQLLKDSSKTHIIYTIDRSQSIANSSLSYAELKSVLVAGQQEESALTTVFRSAPEIVSLAFEVLSSGASIFTSLDNPLCEAQISLTFDEENKSSFPVAYGFPSDEKVVLNSFKYADAISENIGVSKSRVAIIAATDSILSDLKRFADVHNKPYEIISRRADKESIRKAEKKGAYIIAGIDYVGGLEFDGVVIAGADVGHIPPVESNVTDSRHFVTHASYNRLYVAITRARLAVVFLFSRSRGLSELLAGSVKKGLLLEEI